MVPNIGNRGRSFKGVTAYLLHDKQADTSERVEFTETRNLPFQDVESASRFMAYTDMNAETLKDIHAQALGLDAPKSGRKAEAGNVLHSSLSWGDKQTPTREEMTQAADDWVNAQGWQDHQYYLVAHNDTDHSHIHIVLNLVHPVTGQIADQSHSKLKSDRWAQDYEEATGEIVCENRDAKYQAMENEQPAFSMKEHREEAYERITAAYHASDSGSAFAAALEYDGFDLAQGRKRALVVVDEKGEVYAPDRAIDGVSRREINQLFRGIDKSALPHADELQEQRQYFDRDEAEAKQQTALMDAAEEAAQRKLAAEDKAPAASFEQAAHDPHERGSVVQIWGSRAQGKVTGYENGRYEVTFTNGRTGKETVTSFKPDEIKLIRTAYEENIFQYNRERERAAWTDWNLVRERQTRERIEERRDYWQLDKLTIERDEAQKALEERSGWVNRYVLRWRYQDARDELGAKEKTLANAQARWKLDIDAIQTKRTTELRNSLDTLRQSLQDQGLDRASELEAKQEQQKLQRDMTAAELEEFAQEILADIEGRLEQQRGERIDAPEGEAPQKQQRDMTGDELDAYRQQLMDDMQSKRDEQYQEQDTTPDHGESREAESFDAAEVEESIMEAEDDLQRDMSEQELEAYRERLREIIVETQGMQVDEPSPEKKPERDIG